VIVYRGHSFHFDFFLVLYFFRLRLFKVTCLQVSFFSFCFGAFSRWCAPRFSFQSSCFSFRQFLFSQLLLCFPASRFLLLCFLSVVCSPFQLPEFLFQPPTVPVFLFSITSSGFSASSLLPSFSVPAFRFLTSDSSRSLSRLVVHVQVSFSGLCGQSPGFLQVSRFLLSITSSGFLGLLDSSRSLNLLREHKGVSTLAQASEIPTKSVPNLYFIKGCSVTQYHIKDHARSRTDPKVGSKMMVALDAGPCTM
jgi:hypothetical protein